MALRRFSNLGWRTLRSSFVRPLPNTLRYRLSNVRHFSDVVDGQAESVKSEEPVVEQPQETVTGKRVSQTFQAETRELLNIVSKSLYTEKEVFIRELLSNASDALEKTRFKQAAGEDLFQPEKPLEINIFTDKIKNTITVQDFGLGMNAEELVENIGTIARSGSKAFVRAMNEQATKAESIIGQFGVGFYSAFMVSDKVEVYSQSTNGDKANYWVSDGAGTFEMAEAENVERGTKIIIHLKSDCAEFADKYRVETIVKKYSSYLQYPIKLNNSVLTSTGALWAKTPKEVTDEQHKEFYQLISNTYDAPNYVYHSHFENVKYSIQCLLYIPGSHSEKVGFGRLDPGVSVYSRRVLIKPKAKEILPDWCRFLKGVVDSENIPLHISRENLQDSALIQEINETIMLKVVDFLKRQEKKDAVKYREFYKDFNSFIKEGCCTDYKNRRKIAHLLRYESSKLEKGELTSIDDYIERAQEDQKDVYYIVAPNRETAFASPYMEHLLENDIEVLLAYAQIDQFVFDNLQTYRQKDLLSVEKSKIAPTRDENQEQLTEAQSTELCEWIAKNNTKISECDVTHRLKQHPAILVDHTSQSVRSYLRALNEDMEVGAQKMHINPSHEVIRGLYHLRSTEPEISDTILRQVVDNAFIGAGLMEDSREMLTNINEVLTMLVKTKLAQASEEAAPQENAV